jgi:UDP-N-acetyl-D-mannosaminuronate dehydrogenase
VGQATNIKTTLINKLQDRIAEIAVLGLGYVGLPLAVVSGGTGSKVTGEV